MLEATAPETSCIEHHCFNAATRMKMVPLRNEHIPELPPSSTSKGIRGVRLHSLRYNPTMQDMTSDDNAVRYSDSMLNLQKQKTCQELHYERQLQQLGQARQRKSAPRSTARRANFYINGQSACINRRSMFSTEEMEQLKLKSISENKQLYYGRVLALMHNNRPPPSSIAKLQDNLMNDTTDDLTGLELNRFMPTDTRSRGQTQLMSVTFGGSISPSPRKTLLSAVHGKKAFMTEAELS